MEMFKIEKRFLYKDYECIIIKQPMGWHCAYVNVPKENKFYNMPYWKLPITAHGGITYAEKYLNGVYNYDKDLYIIGWDYAHFGVADTDIKTIIKDCVDVVDQLIN